MFEQSVREWVLRALPYDRSDADLVRHLEAKNATSLLTTYHNWISRFPSSKKRKIVHSTTLQRNPKAVQYADALGFIVRDIRDG